LTSGIPSRDTCLYSAADRPAPAGGGGAARTGDFIAQHAGVPAGVEHHLRRTENGLRGELQRMEDATPNVDPRLANDKLDAANADTNALLQPFDDKARALLDSGETRRAQQVAHAMLERVQTQRRDGCRIGMIENAEDAALILELVQHVRPPS